MDQRLQLTRHVFLERARDAPERLLVCHALVGRCLELSEDEWRQLSAFGEPRSLTGTSGAPEIGPRTTAEAVGRDQAPQDLIARARASGLLVTPDGSETRWFVPEDFLARFDQAFCEVFHLTPAALSQRADREAGTNPGAQLLFKLDWLRAALEVRRGPEGPAPANRVRAQKLLLGGHWLLGQLRGVIALNLRESAPSVEGWFIDGRLCRAAADRPAHDASLKQQPCMPETANRRARRIARAFPLGGRVLVLGDDDLLSVALAPLGDFEVHVAELDARLALLIQTVARARSLNITVHRVDLLEPLPDHLRGFTVVTTDPPYTSDGSLAFLERAREAAVGSSRVFLSTNPSMHEDFARLEHEARRLEFQWVSREENFNRYRCCPEWLEPTRNAWRLIGFPTSLASALVPAYLYADFFELRLPEHAGGFRPPEGQPTRRALEAHASPGPGRTEDRP